MIPLIRVNPERRGGLVVEFRPWDVGAPGSKPNSTEDPPCMGPATRYTLCSGQTPSRWCGVVWKLGAQVWPSSSDHFHGVPLIQ
ncbi:hypothetical protein AVEN_117820-1 [Araneus ventricosus]|uniref:Uncharacterized protein n=1 Tax=Araneus ventricosus TaxID=182803 RepID=A0A4Y2B7R2_ARAVE|nr:hypothetical protein AVEN_117820-1 [Araneus ventricosus]